jgi:hypothetical protein
MAVEQGGALSDKVSIPLLSTARLGYPFGRSQPSMAVM